MAKCNQLTSLRFKGLIVGGRPGGRLLMTAVDSDADADAAVVAGVFVASFNSSASSC